MSRDYSNCAKCNTIFDDDDDYALYCDCGFSFCGKGCAKLENFHQIIEKEIEDLEETDPKYQDWIDGNNRVDKDKPITCVICRKEAVNDYVLLQALLIHFNITKDQAIEIYMKQED